MSRLSVIGARLRGQFGRNRLERKLDDEVRFHLEMQIEDNVRTGMDPAEARSAALRSFGGIASMKERYREQSAFELIQTMPRDVLYANPPQEPRLYDGLRNCTGIGDWREYRHVQRASHRPASVAPVSIPGAVGDAVERDSVSERPGRQVGLLGCGAVAVSKQDVFGHGRV